MGIPRESGNPQVGISEEDAAKVTKALDEMDGTSAQTTSATKGAASAGGGRPAGGGGGGGGGSTEKTELSRVETVAGGIKTTVITYTDGTTETETSVAVAGDDTKTAKPDDAAKTDASTKTQASGETKSAGEAKGDPAADQSVQEYLAQIEPGTLFEGYA